MPGFGTAGIFKEAANKKKGGKLRKAWSAFQGHQRESMGVKPGKKGASLYDRFRSHQRASMRPKDDVGDHEYR